MALTKVTGQVINDSTGLVVGVTTVGGGLSATDGFFSGIVTAVGDASFSGNVSVGGTLTYEDVTNIDAVGLVTARNGIVVGSGITLSKDGDVFFTGIATGNGSGLTDLNASNLASGTVPSARLGSGTASSSTFLAGDSTFKTVTGTTINNNADNRLITGSGTANTLEAESTLTYDASLLNITSTTQGLGARFTNTGNEYTELRFSANRTAENNALGIINAKWNNNHTVASIYLQAGSDTTNKDDGQIQFFTAASGGSGQSRMKIQNDGNISITDGDLIVGSGHGINFQDTSDSSGTQESELLDDYEEGTFTPTINASSSSPSMSYTQQSGRYTKIGNLVYITVDIRWSGRSGGSGNAQLGGFPFTSRSSQPYSGGIVFEKNKLTSHADEAIISLEVGSNQSYGTFLSTVHDSSDSSSGLVIGNFQNTSGYLMVSLNYFTD